MMSIRIAVFFFLVVAAPKILAVNAQDRIDLVPPRNTQSSLATLAPTDRIPTFEPSADIGATLKPTTTIQPTLLAAAATAQPPLIIPTFEPFPAATTSSGLPSNFVADASDSPSTLLSRQSVIDSLPSDVPSVSPSIFPSARRTPAPTATLSPSDGPTLDPTGDPTTSPSMAPSFLSSDLPSVIPSMVPTVSPTDRPSWPPSQSPTMIPSDLPSMAPSMICHDDDSYRSSINGLACDDHANTDCIQWQYLGLTTEKLVELIERCPVACQIECGTFHQVDTTLQYIIYGAKTFLSPESVDTMASVGTDFFKKYVRDALPDSRFFLYEVELRSQTLVVADDDASAGNNRSRKQRQRQLRETDQQQLRRLQQSERTLGIAVSVQHGGYGIGVQTTEVARLIETALESTSYLLALQATGDQAFANVRIDSGKLDQVTPAVEGLTTSDRESHSRQGAIVGATMSIVVISVLGLSAYYYVTKILPKRHRLRTGKSMFEDLRMGSPAESQRSPVSSVFSFDSAGNAVSTFMRIIAPVLSPRSGQDGSSTSTDDSPEKDVTPEPSSLAPMEHDPAAKVPEIEQSPSNESSSGDEVHPFEGLIPPMIVIDHIDGEDNVYTEKMVGTDPQKASSSFPKKQKIKLIVPTKHVEATAELIDALNDNSRPFDPSAFAGVLSGVPFPSVYDPDQMLVLVQKPSEFSLKAPSLEAASSTEDERLADFRVNSTDSSDHDGKNGIQRLAAIGSADTSGREDEDGDEVPTKTTMSLEDEAEVLRQLCRVVSDSMVVNPTRPARVNGDEPAIVGSATGSPSTSAPGSLPAAETRISKSLLSMAIKRGKMARMNSECSNSKSECDTNNSSPANRSYTMSPMPVATYRSESISPTGDRQRSFSEATTVKRGYHSDDEIAEHTTIGLDLRQPCSSASSIPKISFSPRKVLTGIRAPSPAGSGRSMESSSSDNNNNSSNSNRLPAVARAKSHQHHSRNNSRSSTTFSDDGLLLVFQAPRKGKLGLVIENSEMGGPNVTLVKNYSPLLGHVLPGDRIVDIDGIDTSAMKMSEVLALLSGNNKAYWKSSTTVKIVVSRRERRNPPDLPISADAVNNIAGS